MQIARQRKYVLFIFFGVLTCGHLFFLASSFSQENKVASPAPASETLSLVQATMCEEVVDQVKVLEEKLAEPRVKLQLKYLAEPAEHTALFDCSPRSPRTL